MSISDNYVPLKELGNGTTTEFSDNWAILSATFIRVYLEDVTTGVQTLQTQGSDYTLTFDDSGFVVTFAVAPTSDNYVVIAREVSQDQSVPYKTSKGFQGFVQEGSFDKLTAITQDMQDDIDRSPKSQVGSPPLVFPPFVEGRNVGWSNVDGTMENSESTLAEVDGAVVAVAALTAQSGVKVSEDDTTVGFLDGKLIAGTSINFTVNDPASSESMTLDVPAASETVVGAVEAATTAEMDAGTADKFPDAAKVKAYADGLPLANYFESAEQTLTAGGSLTIAHGLSVEPTLFQALLINKTAQLGYSVGDKVFISTSTNADPTTASAGMSLVPDDTNINIRFGSNSAVTGRVIDKSNGDGEYITPANWKLIIRAWV